MSKFAFPSSRVTRIHGAHTHVVRGEILPRPAWPDIIGRKTQPVRVCEWCHGVGMTPLGDACDEATALKIAEGFWTLDDDGHLFEPCKCDACDGDGVQPDDDFYTPRDRVYSCHTEDEFRFVIAGDYQERSDR